MASSLQADTATGCCDFLPKYLVSLNGRLTIFWDKFIAAVRKSGSDQVPLLMLPKRFDADMVQFYTLTKSQIYNTNLPETIGKACFASLGWLITVTKDTADDGELKFSMFHPSMHSRIEIPNGGTDFIRFPLENVLKFVVSSNPRLTSDYIVMFQSYSSLGFCRPGLGQSWKRLTFDYQNYFTDLTYYQGNFYVVNRSGRVSVVCDIEDPERAHLSVVAPEIPDLEELLGRHKGIKNSYLVESAGSLLVVLCTSNHYHYETTSGCRVFKVPFSSGSSWSNSEVFDLGDRALFLSKSNSSFSVEVSSNSGCKANCIYFMNNKLVSPSVDLDIGIFHMENGKIDRDFAKSFNTGFEEVRESHLWIQPQ
ncbi:uncharacterized protein LOC126784111 [Argentina anserina]|uniref:uncharacterized protein LOC126784111 n=1 Tax=Argentina anserina TaxID=57926 RepID=UPI002176817F|nr:uncharacterized protein LOC126784111 [Potentilla anserina]